jgi:hypothetical protein
MRHVSVALALVLLLSATTRAATPPATGESKPAGAAAAKASVEGAHSDFAGGDYRGALRQLDRLLFYSVPELPAGQRYDMLMLKGECQVQLQDRIGATSAFKSAAKAAGDLNQLAAAQANALILERSSSGLYKPRYGVNKEPINILPMDSRKQAMAALQADLGAQYKTLIDAALQSDKLTSIEQVFSRVADMYYLELATSGDAPQTGAVMRDLGQHAFQLMQSEISRCARRVEQLSQMANSSGVSGRGWDTGRMGLTSPQRDELKSMVPYLAKIRDRATEYRRVAARLGGNEAKWDSLVADSTDAAMDAEALYNDR